MPGQSGRPGAKTTASGPAGRVPHSKSSKSAPWGYNGVPTAMAVEFFMQPTRDFRTCLWAGTSEHPLGPLGGPWAIRVPPYKAHRRNGRIDDLYKVYKQ